MDVPQYNIKSIWGIICVATTESLCMEVSKKAKLPGSVERTLSKVSKQLPMFLLGMQNYY